MLILKGLTYTDLLIGSYVLMAIIGIELGIIIRLRRRIKSLKDSLSLTSEQSNKPTNQASDPSEIPKIKKEFIKNNNT